MVEHNNIGYDNSGNIIYKHWTKDGHYHRIGKPARIWYYDSGQKRQEIWWEHGKMHRFDGPASILFDKLGDVKLEDWYVYGNKLCNYPLSKEEQIELKLKYG